MRFARHFVEWHGQRFTLEPLQSRSKVTSLSPTWAVIRQGEFQGEFIGTLPYRLSESPGELDTRCINWLRDLLEAPRPSSS
jgi:hypothetical protein